MSSKVSESAPNQGVARPLEDLSALLVASFARALREYDRVPKPSDAPARRVEVNDELDAHSAEFAAHWKANGATPEQMLIDLKQLLARAAPEVDNSVRAAIMASTTRSAIFAFFGR